MSLSSNPGGAKPKEWVTLGRNQLYSSLSRVGPSFFQTVTYLAGCSSAEGSALKRDCPSGQLQPNLAEVEQCEKGVPNPHPPSSPQAFQCQIQLG